MASRRTSVALSAAMLALAAALAAQEPATQDPEAQQQMQSIMRDRPPQAEMAARAAVYNFDPSHFGAPGNTAAPSREPGFVVDGVRQAPTTGVIPVPVLDQLKAADPEAYWREVATLTVQFGMFGRIAQRDNDRARAMLALFRTEFEARVIQRAWRTATEAQHTTMRSQLTTLMAQHFDMENQLRDLEVRDIERRLADARAESDRRRQNKDQMVRWSVDDIIHGAERPD